MHMGYIYIRLVTKDMTHLQEPKFHPLLAPPPCNLIRYHKRVPF